MSEAIETPLVAPDVPVASPTVTFIPRVTFTGYIDDVTETLFVAGRQSVPVSPEFAQLMRDKGLVADDETTGETI